MALALLCALAATPGCGGTAATPGTPDAGAAPDAGPSATADAGLPADGGAPAPLVWPDPRGPANGSAWLRENHERLTGIRPRVLVLDVQRREGRPALETFVEALMAAFAEGSRHRGYVDPAAPAFLQYQLERIVDLRDPAGAEYPSFWPPQTARGFDVGVLFTDEFAPRLGYRDPDDAARYLTMCELFERGLVNELWISAEAGVRNIYENQSRLQVYDEAGEPIPGMFDGCTNGCFYDPGARVRCAVSVRMQEINLTRGVGCGTHAAGHALEHLRFVHPYLRDNMTRFLDFELEARHGLPMDSLYDCPYADGLCVERPSPARVESAATWTGRSFAFDGWGEGCGSVHFPPNARFQYDYYSDLPALSSCAGYGRGEGPGGADLRAPYTDAVTGDYEAAHGDCGGGWVVYWSQSMPGLGNAATDARGAPMRNWWPYLFY